MKLKPNEKSLWTGDSHLKNYLANLCAKKLWSLSNRVTKLWENYGQFFGKLKVWLSGCFKCQDQRLDIFLFETENIHQFPAVADIVVYLSTHSHGQASVEHGFSIKKSMLKTNMTQILVVSRRIIRNDLEAIKLEPCTIALIDDVMKHAKFCRSRCNTF